MQAPHMFEGHSMHRGSSVAPYQQQNSWPGANHWYNRMPGRDPAMHYPPMPPGYRPPYHPGHFMPVEYAPRHFINEPRMPFDMAHPRDDMRMQFQVPGPAYGGYPGLPPDGGAQGIPNRFPAPGCHHMNGRVPPENSNQFETPNRSTQHQQQSLTIHR